MSKLITKYLFMCPLSKLLTSSNIFLLSQISKILLHGEKKYQNIRIKVTFQKQM